MLSLLDMKKVVGRVGSTTANNYTIHVSVWETGTSIADNTSTVKYKMWITADNDKYITEYDGSTKYMSGWSVDGAQLRATITLAGRQVAQTTGYYTLYWNRSYQNFAELIAEGTTTVTHNADGNLNMSIVASLEQLNNYSSNPSNGSISTSGWLDYIPRASTATLNKSSLTADGSSVTITINKATSSFTSTLTWKYGSKTGTLLNKQSNGSATFTPNPVDLYGQGLSGTVYFYLTTYNGNTQVGDQKTYSVSLTIPAVSTIKGTDANIGSVSTLTIIRNSTAYSHSVYYSFVNLSQYITSTGGVGSETKYTNTSVPFTVPTSFYAQIPNSKTGTVYVYVKTYYGNSQVGSTQSASFTTTASNSAPTITNVSAVDQNSTTVALTGNSAKQVRYYSNTKVSFTASAKNSASVSATSIGGVSTGATTSPNRTFNGYDGSSIGLYVRDSRGYEASSSTTPTMINYVKLTTNHRVYRPQPTDGSARIVFSGDYWAGNFGAVANTLTLWYRWKEVGGTYTQWILVENVTISGNKYTATVDRTGFDYKTDYQFQLAIQDKLIAYYPEDSTTLLRAGESVYDWGKKDFNFNVPVHLERIKSKNKTGTSSSNIVVVPMVSYTLIEPNHDTQNYFRELCKWICANYPDMADTVFQGVSEPNSRGYYFVHIYNTNNVNASGYPQYASGLYCSIQENGQLIRFGFYNYVYNYNAVKEYSDEYLTYVSKNRISSWLSSNNCHATLYPVGSFVILNLGGYLSSAMSAGTWYQIATLPQVIRPSGNVLIASHCNGQYAMAYVQANNGAVMVKPTTNISANQEVDAFGVYKL